MRWQEAIFVQLAWELVAQVLFSVTGSLRPRFNFQNFINRYVHYPKDNVERNFSRIISCICTRNFAQYCTYAAKFESFFLFRDTSRYIRHVTRSGNFLCNLYAIRLHRHLLLRMHSHLKQLRSLVKKKMINSYLYFFNCASFHLVLEYRTLPAWYNALLK
jgi:hypothetical protein